MAEASRRTEQDRQTLHATMRDPTSEDLLRGSHHNAASRLLALQQVAVADRAELLGCVADLGHRVIQPTLSVEKRE